MTHTVVFHPATAPSLNALDPKRRSVLDRALEVLKQTPFPPVADRMAEEGAWCVWASKSIYLEYQVTDSVIEVRTIRVVDAAQQGSPA